MIQAMIRMRIRVDTHLSSLELREEMAVAILDQTRGRWEERRALTDRLPSVHTALSLLDTCRTGLHRRHRL